MIAFFFIAAVSIQPPAPTVGDLITVDLDQPAIVQPSPSYEIVSQQGKRVVVRTFEPKPFTLRGTNVVVPVRSVLKPADDLKPAALQPPKLGAVPRLPIILIAIAVLVAALVWTYVIVRGGVRAPVAISTVAPDAQFREVIAALRAEPGRRKRWATLADATRAYLAATRSHLGPELTTREVLAGVESGGQAAALQTILTQGDLEKFSPWGAMPMNFDDVAERALELAA